MHFMARDAIIKEHNMESLILQSNSIIARTNIDFRRFLYDDINWENRMIAILGARGVGKTILLLQYIKLNLSQDESLYVKADDLFFTDSTLYDLARNFNVYGGRYLFIYLLMRSTNTLIGHVR